MVNEFDKEIDAMLRDLAKGDVFAQVLPATHLDADEISAFAENALPTKARLHVTEHLVDCSKCRKILANTISLNSESESEIIHEEPAVIGAPLVIPWYQKLFTFPTLSFAMGGLALLLCGMIGLMVFQNSRRFDSMVAQKPKENADKSYNSAASNSKLESAPLNDSSVSNTANPHSPMATPAPTLANPTSNPVSKDAASNSSVSTEASPTPKTAEEITLADKITDADEAKPATKSVPGTDLAKKEDAAKPVGTPVNEVGENVPTERRDQPRQGDISQNSISQNNQQNILPDSKNVSRQQTVAPPSSASGASREQEKQEPERAKKMANKPADDRKDSSEETLRIGNKSFRKVDGVWTDTSYTGGSTKTVKRGSDDYKKLDSGLQDFGNSFKGTVIIVWGGKAYKIQ